MLQAYVSAIQFKADLNCFIELWLASRTTVYGHAATRSANGNLFEETQRAQVSVGRVHRHVSPIVAQRHTRPGVRSFCHTRTGSASPHTTLHRRHVRVRRFAGESLAEGCPLV